MPCHLKGRIMLSDYLKALRFVILSVVKRQARGKVFVAFHAAQEAGGEFFQCPQVNVAFEINHFVNGSPILVPTPAVKFGMVADAQINVAVTPDQPQQAGELKFDHGHAFDRVQPDGNAASVVVYGKRTVVVDAHVDFSGETAQRLVRRVVDDFLADVGRAVGAGVHAGTFFDRLQAFEDGDAGFAVLCFAHVKYGSDNGLKILCAF